MFGSMFHLIILENLRLSVNQRRQIKKEKKVPLQNEIRGEKMEGDVENINWIHTAGV